jgi:hypothetical protein
MIFPSPVGMSLTKLSLAGKNFIIPPSVRVLLLASRLGTGKSLTFFTVYMQCKQYFSLLDACYLFLQRECYLGFLRSG